MAELGSVHAVLGGFERFALGAMGTRFELVLPQGAADARALADAAWGRVVELHRLWSLFDRGSLLTRINAAAGAGPVLLDGDTLALLKLAGRVWRDSGGAFDPTVADAMRREGLHEWRAASTDAAADGAASFAVVRVTERPAAVAFDRPGAALDFGGIAKGAALDAAREELAEAGCRSAFMHGGTSTAWGIGRGPEGGPWRVRLAAGEVMGPTVLLSDAALSVSSPTGRVTGGGRSHIIDPRSREALPVEACPVLAAVVDASRSPSAALCDAWSTALLVLGERPAAMPGWLSSIIGVRERGGGVRWVIEGPADDVVTAGAAGHGTGEPKEPTREAKRKP